MADAGHLRFVGDEPGREWHDWNCQMAPRVATPKGRGRRSRRFNPHHDHANGQFTSGGGGGGFGNQPHKHQVNEPTADGASTADGHDVKGEIPGIGRYADHMGPTVHGVAIPDLGPAGRAKLDKRIAEATAPPKGHPRPERWKGRDEEEVFGHALKPAYGRADAMDTHVRNGEHEELKAALTDRREGKANAKALAYARAVMPALDAKVKSGELVRTFEDSHSYAMTRLRPAHAGAEARYNPYHGKDGKFTGPHGGGDAGKIVPHRKPGAGTPAAPKSGVDFAGKAAPEIKAHHEAIGASWRKALTEDERHAVRTYTGQSYDPINQALRSGQKPTGLVVDLDRAIGKSTLARDTIVYRGVKDPGKLGLHEGNLVGATIRDRAFTSTSLDRRVAEKYAGPSGAVLRIHAPAGTKAASMAKVSRYDKEREVLFPRGATIRVTGVGGVESGRRILHAELSHD